MHRYNLLYTYTHAEETNIKSNDLATSQHTEGGKLTSKCSERPLSLPTVPGVCQRQQCKHNHMQGRNQDLKNCTQYIIVERNKITHNFSTTETAPFFLLLFFNAVARKKSWFRLSAEADKQKE